MIKRWMALALWAPWVVFAQASETITVAGQVQQERTYSVSELLAFPPSKITTITFPSKNSSSGATSLRGVRIAVLIEEAGLVQADRNTWKNLLVSAQAQDGYRVVFSWSELTNTPVGDQALVVFERNGQPLPEREGRLALYSGADKHQGPRTVRQVKRLVVKSFE